MTSTSNEIVRRRGGIYAVREYNIEHFLFSNGISDIRAFVTTKVEGNGHYSILFEVLHYLYDEVSVITLAKFYNIKSSAIGRSHNQK